MATRSTKANGAKGRKKKRSGGAVTQLPEGKRKEILLMNPDAVLLAEIFDPALVGAAQPMYVHQPDVWVAVYDRNKVYDILSDVLSEEEPDADEDDISAYCPEEFWKLWEFALGDARREHLPVVIDTREGWSAEATTEERKNRPLRGSASKIAESR